MGKPDAELDKERRAFIKKVLNGAIAGSLLLVIPMPIGAATEEIPEQIPGIRGKKMGHVQSAFCLHRGYYPLHRVRFLLRGRQTGIQCPGRVLQDLG